MRETSTASRSMTGKVFADTNVLLYLIADDDPRRAQAESILAGRPTISTQVVNEFAANAVKKGGRTREEAQELAIALIDCCELRAIDGDTLRLGFSLFVRYRLSIWDGMILAAALEAGAEILYSEDMQDGQIIDSRLRIVNPFQS